MGSVMMLLLNRMIMILNTLTIMMILALKMTILTGGIM